MKLAFDSAKDAANIAKHGVSLARALDVEVEVVSEDARFVYGETRYRAFGLLDGFACCLVFTVQDGAMRAISLRRAHLKEYNRHAR